MLYWPKSCQFKNNKKTLNKRKGAFMMRKAEQIYSYEEQIRILADRLRESKAIVIGGASGMSAAAGYRHYYMRDEMFVENWGEYEKKYGFHNSFDGFYYPYRTPEEKWGFYASSLKQIMDAPLGKPYMDLRDLLEGKNYHVLTTNQDLQFIKAFPEEKVSQIQGEWRFFQCSRRCHDALYDAVKPVHEMAAAIDKDLKVPTELLPHCPKCGALMEPWVRSYTFLEGKRYREEYRKVNDFLKKNHNKRILFLELGVGRMTPMFIQEPFWNLTYAWPQAYYISINPKDALLPKELTEKGTAISEDIAKVLVDVKTLMESEAADGAKIKAIS